MELYCIYSSATYLIHLMGFVFIHANVFICSASFTFNYNSFSFYKQSLLFLTVMLLRDLGGGVSTFLAIIHNMIHFFVHFNTYLLMKMYKYFRRLSPITGIVQA